MLVAPYSVGAGNRDSGSFSSTVSIGNDASHIVFDTTVFFVTSGVSTVKFFMFLILSILSIYAILAD